MSTVPLPDPCADLHWSEFAGAIQDKFAVNAIKYPDRDCVIETASSPSSLERKFSYWEIHQASNIIAHLLLQNGIKHGQVVMIYAYRGVELVIAILGTLKAGAAFSVIDPAYPKDRQIIYLEVARPNALIVIEKAKREYGGLADLVWNWIDRHLYLSTTITGLELESDGNLRGGSTEPGGFDVLYRSFEDLKDVHPGQVVGPDSQPTLSFTSGSEGIPKGCIGRHFSLTYYQAFMAEKFGMSENDSFTMLSGIAHDPIQRDIFTPLFLGAKLLIPPKEDIQHERLAEWMKMYKPTVTHLTPAMGQILVGGANAIFPSLKNAFFVGDILMKRDCIALQSLAPNCRVVNMFGTTETQRAVSFFDIPSRNEDPKFLENMGDVIPAGRGMKDVQLLVVNRESLKGNKPQLCKVGETGEIFVRAGGLAEGYLGSDELNKQKFIPNFFRNNDDLLALDLKLAQVRRHLEPWRAHYKGPRDRLYRSGDLGRYTESGDCECVGRADSQVKIRGFRIELGEIDTYISHHPLVRENVTLVRRDKDEEPTLVSYIVPDLSRWSLWLDSQGLPPDVEDDSMSGMLRRFTLLRDDVKADLRKKLPVHAIPSVIIPLKRMPLTPNAKIDKRALPYPDAAEMASSGTAAKTSRDQYSPTEKYMGEVWAQRIPGVSAESIGLDDRFFDIGGHSMVGQSVLFDIRKGRGISLSMNTLFQNPTLREFAAVLDAAGDLSDGDKQDSTPAEMDYHLDGEVLRAKFQAFRTPPGDYSYKTVLLTGVTGFLGAHILADLLRSDPKIHVYAHMRADSVNEGFRRIKDTCEAYDIWNPTWFRDKRFDVVLGDLSKPVLGIDTDEYDMLAEKVGIIIHNGARVHWQHSYSYLKFTNVISTAACITLCGIGRPKHLTFVSSTATLDSPSWHSFPIHESDTLNCSRTGLTNGYGQTKYVSEYLMRHMGQTMGKTHTLQGSIIRPGYITGDPHKGIGPTDDFLLRLLKGSIQLGCAPDLGENTINLVPVSHCARIVVAASLRSFWEDDVGIVHVTPHPPLPFKTFFGALEAYGYNAPIIPYDEWKERLEAYVAASTTSTAPPTSDTGTPLPSTSQSTTDLEPHALLPLFDWVTDNLPRDTRSKKLLDENAERIVEIDSPEYNFDGNSQVTQETVGMYLAFMVAVGFVKPPEGEKGRILPKVDIVEAQRSKLEKVGRSGGGK